MRFEMHLYISVFCHSFSCSQQLKIFESRNQSHIQTLRDTRTHIHKHKWPHEIPTRKILDPQNIHEKKTWTHEIPSRKKIRTHETPTREYFGPTKYPRWQDGTSSTRPTMARDSQHLAHLGYYMDSCFIFSQLQQQDHQIFVLFQFK